MKCGHQEPSNELTSSTGRPNLAFLNVYDLNLKKSDEAFVKIGEKINVYQLNSYNIYMFIYR